jgi:nitroreductase
MLDEASVFEQIVRSRRSMRIYDNEIQYNPEIVKKSLELAILSPNSSNMQLWEFYRIRSEQAKKVMAHNCLDQRSVETASEIVVFVARPDKYKKSIKFNLETLEHTDNFESERSKNRRRTYYGKLMPLFYAPDRFFILSLLKKVFVFFVGMKRPIVREVSRINKKVTIHKSVALAAQTFMLAIKAQGYDTCPIEGFDSRRIKKQLNLPCKAEINMVVTVGKGTHEGVFYMQRRYPYQEVVFEK